MFSGKNMAEAASNDFEMKMTQLQVTKSKTKTVLSSGSVNWIKRHKDSLHAIVATVEKSKWKVEELKIAGGEEITAINVWGDKVEEELTTVDKDMDSIAKYLRWIRSLREGIIWTKVEIQPADKGKSLSNTSHMERQERKAKAM